MKTPIYYRATMQFDEDGLHVQFAEYQSIHETPCYSYCVVREKIARVACRAYADKTTKLKAAKRIGLTIKRIHKGCSRFAHPTKEHALASLKYRKRKQIQHLKRELDFAETFVEKDPGMNDLIRETYMSSNWYVVPGTADVIHKHVIFD